MKICTCCKISREEKDFFFHVRSKNYRSQCKACLKLKNKLRFLKNKKNYYLNLNKDLTKICTSCKEIKLLKDFAVFQAMCKSCKNHYARMIYIKNPLPRRISNKKYENKIKKENSLVYQKILLIQRVRARIRVALKKNYNPKFSTSLKLVGCSSWEEYKKYLESKFTNGMNWDDFNKGNIHIDHIKPCTSFDLSKFEEQAKCFHYSNTQPLWAKDNLSKANKLPTYGFNLSTISIYS